jgi:hypothetical protein
MTEQILNITTNLGYWGVLNSHSDVVISIDSTIGSFNRDYIMPLSTDEYVPTKGDKVYFLPGVTVPRVKFKEIALEYGIRTVRNPNDANVFFGNISTADKITDSRWVYKIETKYLIDALDNNTLDLDEFYIDKLKTALEFYTNEFIATDHPFALAIAEDAEKNQVRMQTISDDYTELGKALEGKIIYEESTIIDKLNGQDASVIDAVMFEQLSTMFKSSDSDNHILGMEILANCKYSASLPYMLLLFKDFSGNMYNSNTKNHVNFKSLVNWLGGNILHRNSIDDLCDILKDKGQLTPDRLDIFLDHSHQDILNRGDSGYFKVKTITLDEEILASLNTNYTYATVYKDYVPVEIEEEVSDEDITDAFTMMERNELKSELIALEAKEDLEAVKEEIASEEDVAHQLYGVDNDNIEVSLTPEPVSNNNQITETNGSIDDFDWF